MKLPLLSIPDKPISSTTQDLLPVADIADGIIVYKNGGAALVMESTSLNFGLLSDREQQAVIAAYAGILNSFTYPVQIVVRTQKKDITSYMKFLAEAHKKIKNPKLDSVMSGYERFIVDEIKKKNVLSKKFYIIVPFTPYELGITKSFASTFSPKKRHAPLPFPKSYVFRKAKITLFPKRDHLVRQAKRLGVALKQLNDDELLTLFYKTFNPEPPVKEEESFI